MSNKLAKRALLSQQRVEEAVSRKAFYTSLMENPSSNKFYQLIRKSKSSKEDSSSCIVVDGVRYTDTTSQRKCFAQYYEDLAVPKDNGYDNVFMKLCNLRCEQNRACLSDSSDNLSFGEVDIEKVINKLHNGKSPDEYGISAELFKAGKSEFNDNNFSAQFIKIISHYKKIGYNINVLQQTACLVVNPITVGNFAFLFNCTLVGRTSDSMMVPT